GFPADDLPAQSEGRQCATPQYAEALTLVQASQPPMSKPCLAGSGTALERVLIKKVEQLFRDTLPTLAPDLVENPLCRWKREERLHRHAELTPPVRPLLICSRKVDRDRFHREIIGLDECQRRVRGCHISMHGSGGRFAERGLRVWH